MFNLSENPLLCDCNLEWLGNHTNIKGKCTAPIYLAGQDIQVIPYFLFMCPQGGDITDQDYCDPNTVVPTAPTAPPTDPTFQCPPPQEITYCQCTPGPTGITLSCSGSEFDLTALISTMSAVGYSITSMTLNDCNIPEIRGSPFSAKHIQGLFIERCYLRVLSTDALKGLEDSLMFLAISENKLSSVPTLAIRDLEMLISLQLNNNGIDLISSVDFSKLASSNTLKALDLQHNRIKSISSGTATKLKVLVINVSTNQPLVTGS